MILLHRTRADMSFLTFFLHTLVKSNKTVKSAKNTICDTCAQNSRRYEFCDIFVHTVVLSRKTVKSAKNTFCDICAQNSLRYEFCDIFASYSCIMYVKLSNKLRTRFVILVHRTRAVYEFCDIFAQTVVLGRETVKSSSNTICDTCAQNSRTY